MTQVYRRFFEVVEGEFLKNVEQAIAINHSAMDAYMEIAKEIGAHSDRYYASEKNLIGFYFDKKPGDTYKRVGPGAFYPKRNNKPGKALHERIAAIQVCNTYDYSPLGLAEDGRWVIVYGGTAYSCSTTFLPKTKRVFVAVPWQDNDPDKHDRNPHMLWTPASHMVEMKEWEVQRAIDEYNEMMRGEDSCH